MVLVTAGGARERHERIDEVRVALGMTPSGEPAKRLVECRG